MGVRWYVAYPLSTRHVEELMEERGVDVDHSTTNRWTITYSPLLEVTVQVVTTGITPQLATAERLREAETEPRHPAGPRHTPR
jgi:hypothetical protein